MLAAWGPLLRAIRRFGGQASFAACHAVARKASGGGVVPDNLVISKNEVAAYNEQAATDT
jgi:hypothetical protein